MERLLPYVFMATERHNISNRDTLWIVSFIRNTIYSRIKQPRTLRQLLRDLVL